jgi:hypothetical protein
MYQILVLPFLLRMFNIPRRNTFLSGIEPLTYRLQYHNYDLTAGCSTDGAPRTLEVLPPLLP